jgi:hypothetical protein
MDDLVPDCSEYEAASAPPLPASAAPALDLNALLERHAAEAKQLKKEQLERQAAELSELVKAHEQLVEKQKQRAEREEAELKARQESERAAAAQAQQKQTEALIKQQLQKRKEANRALASLGYVDPPSVPKAQTVYRLFSKRVETLFNAHDFDPSLEDFAEGALMPRVVRDGCRFLCTAFLYQVQNKRVTGAGLSDRQILKIAKAWMLEESYPLPWKDDSPEVHIRWLEKNCKGFFDSDSDSESD